MLTDPRKRRATSTRTTTAGAVLAVAFLLAFPVSALAQAANPLAGQWHLDEIRQGPASSSTPDSSGHGLDGTVAPGTTLVAGRFASAFNFDAFDGGRVRVPRSAALEPSAVTVLAWVKRAGSPGLYKYVAAKGANGCVASSYALYTGSSGGMRFYVTDGGAGAWLSPSAGPELWDGQWHAIAGTFDGQAVRFYLDGQQIGSGTAAGAPVGYGVGNGDFDIGQYPTNSCGGDFLGGAIDEVRVYDRALSASEIGRLQTAPGSIPPVLQPDATPPPPPPPPGAPGSPGSPNPPTPPPGQASPAPAPRVTAVASAAPIVASRPALLSAQVAGSAQRLEWDLTGDGKTDVSCPGNSTTLGFRPPARTGGASTGQVSVRAVGAAGAGPYFSQKLAIAPAPAIAGTTGWVSGSRPGSRPWSPASRRSTRAGELATCPRPKTNSRSGLISVTSSAWAGRSPRGRSK